MCANPIVDEIWGEVEPEPSSVSPPVALERDVGANPNDDLIGPTEDDEEGEGELIPLGLVLREVELDVREERLARDRKLEQWLESEADARMRAAIAALLNGKPVEDPSWRVLACGVIEKMHGGGFRVWVTDKSLPTGGSWRDRLRNRCSPKGCRFCPRGAP